MVYDIRDLKGFRIDSINSLKGKEREDYLYLFESIFHEFVHVMYSYKFFDYNYLELQDEGSMRSMLISTDVVEQFRTKKIAIDTVIGSSL